MGIQRKIRSWDSAQILVQSAMILDQYSHQRLRDALANSEAQLSPLTDPLKLNLSEHRWLSMDREESYSDWLAWILQGMSSTAEILLLFGRGDEAAGEPFGAVGKVRREISTEHGRTDIEVPLGSHGLLLIEVKIRNPSGELSSQLKRYTQKVADRRIECPLLVLLGVEAPEPDIPLFGFTFIDWQALCSRLRQYANRVKESDLLRAAAILIFCGAVEQNILGFTAWPRRFRSMITMNYLREWSCEV